MEGAAGGVTPLPTRDVIAAPPTRSYSGLTQPRPGRACPWASVQSPPPGSGSGPPPLTPLPPPPAAGVAEGHSRRRHPLPRVPVRGDRQYPSGSREGPRAGVSPGQGGGPGTGGVLRGCSRPWWALEACRAGWGQPWYCGPWLGPCGGAEFLAVGGLLVPSDLGWIPNPSLEISHESPGSSQCLLEHLLTRLQSSSCHVKLKVGPCWEHWADDGMEPPPQGGQL